MGRHAAFVRLLKIGEASPEACPVQRSGERWKTRTYFDKPELCCLLREPYRSTPFIVHRLPIWLKTLHGDDWQHIVWALGQVPRGGYASVIPTLINEMGKRYWDDNLLLPRALANLGRDDLPFLIRALDRGNATQRRGLALALEAIGDPSAIVPLEDCVRTNYLFQSIASVQEAGRQVRQSLDNLRHKTLAE